MAVVAPAAPVVYLAVGSEQLILDSYGVLADDGNPLGRLLLSEGGRLMEIEAQLRSGDKLLTSGQVAKLLGVSRTAVLRWTQDGSGPPFIKIRNNYRFPERSVIAWVEHQNLNNTERG